MKYKILTLIIFFNFFQSCINKEKKQTKKKVIELQEKKIKARKDSIELVKKNRLDSITKIKEKIAIGKINFGIKKKEYIKKKEEFLKLTNRKLGEYDFYMTESFNKNGELRRVWLEGRKIHYNYYKRDMLKIFLSLKEILVTKYGNPTTVYLDAFPKWTEFDKGEVKYIYYWSIGNKTIWLSIKHPDSYYSADVYYQLNISFSYTTPEELEKSSKARERKEKESKENAIKNL
ncbi:hypothetical protein [Tenacibaculum ovolyticum]|uniref:hypothetical protein n=1 Tax=Tenacibaculum ovolyticum TaxID=104270 RepID=UPI0007ECA16C|nr:hypothetical protein [Tenacibaculum ovolyticum]